MKATAWIRRLAGMPKNFYAVIKGRVPGVYSEWSPPHSPPVLPLVPNCPSPCSPLLSAFIRGRTKFRSETEKQTKGFRGSEFKGFKSEGQACAYFKQQKGLISSEQLEQQELQFQRVRSDLIQQEQLLSNILQQGPLEGSSSVTAQDGNSTGEGGHGYDDSGLRRRLKIPPDAEIVYTDGACPSNGREASTAGVGVFYGVNDPRNVSLRLPGLYQTNQRAELHAVLIALERYPCQNTPQEVLPSSSFTNNPSTNPSSTNPSTESSPPNPSVPSFTNPSSDPSPPTIRKTLIIITDSKYVIKALTTWIATWEKNNYLNSHHQPVISKDLFIRARRRLRALSAGGVDVEFRHVLGHQGVWGNEMADRLAVRGAGMGHFVDQGMETGWEDEELDRAIAEGEFGG